MKKILLSVIAFAISVQSFAQFTVDTTATPAQMVTAITAGGIAVSNISFTGVNRSRGTFTCIGTCNLGITGGIILSSGLATGMANSPSSLFNSTNNDTIGDNDLNSIVMPDITFDASVLEFDFNAISDSAMFNFRFGSEEYNDWVNTAFNDVFAFYISGPGIAGLQNIALVPGTSIPVSINTINNGGPYAGTSAGPCVSCAYYLDNVGGTLTTGYDGLTTTLTAIAANLQPCQTYHLKLAVADVSDHIYDTGVIIEAGSFFSPNPAWLFAGGNKITSNTIHICQGSSVTLSAPAGFSYLWNNASTAQSLAVSAGGIYSVQITGSNPNFPIVSQPIQVIVDPQPLGTGTITQSNDTLYSSINAIGYTYSWTLNGAPIVGANYTWLPITQNGCYEVTVQTMSGCYSSSTPFCVTALGVNENYNDKTISVYPNPFNNTCTFSFENSANEKYMFSFFDMMGREVMKKEINGSQTIIDRNLLGNGIYFYTLVSANKTKTHKGKVVIK